MSFSQHFEGSDVVLPAVVVVVAENADAEIGVVENEAAKIAHERLNAEARGNEIVIVRQVADVNFAERFLEREEILCRASCSPVCGSGSSTFVSCTLM